MRKKEGSQVWRKLIILLLLFGPASILIFIGTSKCSHNFKKLDDFGKVKPFTFIDSLGKTHQNKELNGKILLITTLQKTCPEKCAVSMWHLNKIIYEKMRKKGERAIVRIVSFVTDGEGNPGTIEDIREVQKMLRDRVQNYNPKLWMIVTGDPKVLYDFERNDQRLLQEGDEFFGNQAYQELMLLLDKKQHLRMVLSGKTEGMIRRMNQHISLLLKEYAKK